MNCILVDWTSYYKTAFVPERQRIAAPTTAIESFKNVFTISDRELIRVAGVDGYLFLQYLQLLLRIFIPMAIIILPILLPLNRYGDVPSVSGLDSFAWPNVGVQSKRRRLWAHCILAVCVVGWVCFNFYRALRKFVRMRQTILTMPEHRIRASATTILVQTIPRKWLTVAALDALYDVFPGGIKDVWINRDYDELMEKVKKRTKIARALEGAEVNLIIECTNKHKEMEEKKTNEYLDKKGEAEIQLAIDSEPMACLCEVECWGDECKQNPIRKKEAQEAYKKTMAALELMIREPSKKPTKTEGPSMSTSKAAVTALSNTKRPVLAAKQQQKPMAPVKKTMPMVFRTRKTPPPTNPSEMRHAAAVAASKTTMGYSKGRVTSATMRKTVLPGKENQVPAVVPDYSLPPAAFIKRYGVPRFGSEKWLECKLAGCFDEGYTEDLGEAVTADDDAIAEYFRKEAEKDFVLEL